jgi:hypothetical protein
MTNRSTSTAMAMSRANAQRQETTKVETGNEEHGPARIRNRRKVVDAGAGHDQGKDEEK